MAYIEKTAFEARVTNNFRNDLANVTGRFQEGGKDEVVSAGFLCVTGEQLPCEGFGAKVLNENAWYMNKATADVKAGTPIYAANTYDWNLIQDPANGNAYAMGRDTLGLPIPAGRNGTYTRIYFDGAHHYRFGEKNVNGTLGENKFLTIADGLLVPASAAPTDAGSLYFKVIGTGNFTEGTTASFGYVDVIAECVIAAAE